jgi:hypothetical protein
VFFIPAHMMLALFAGFAVHRLLLYVRVVANRVRVPRLIVCIRGTCPLAALPIAALIRKALKRSVVQHTLSTTLRGGLRTTSASALNRPRSVFGYDMFYTASSTTTDVLSNSPKACHLRPRFRVDPSTTIGPSSAGVTEPVPPPPYLMRSCTPGPRCTDRPGGFGRLRGSLTLYEGRPSRRN